MPTLTNCLSLETASAEMRAVAEENTRVKDPVYHVIVSWPEGDNPTDKQIFDSGLKAIKAAGFEGHQYVMAIHRDTANPHVHIMVNRVHPDTYRAIYPTNDYINLDKAMRRLEIEYGWQHAPGPHVVREKDGQQVVELSDDAKLLPERQPQKAKDNERRTGCESLYTYVRGEPRADVERLLKRDDATWQDLHLTMAKHGLEIRPVGQGLGVFDKTGQSDVPVKASDMWAEMSKGKLQKRLGEFEPPARFAQIETPARTYDKERELQRPEPKQQKETKRDPAERERRRNERAEARSDLKGRYDKYRSGFKLQKGLTPEQSKTLADTCRDKSQAITEKAKARRSAIHTDKSLSKEAKQALLGEVTAIATKERDRLQAELTEQRKAMHQENNGPKPQPYREWVADRAQEGDEAALAQLRGWAYADKRKAKEIEDADRAAERGNAFIMPVQSEPTRPLRVTEALSWQVDTTTGMVHYKLAEREAFTDTGTAIHFKGEKTQDDTIHAGLLVAREKFKGQELTVTGTEDFRAQVARVAADRGLSVRFADPQMQKRYEAEVERKKAPQEHQKQHERSQERDRGMRR